ncbi:lactose permease [Plectosphaerella cucumerina]|uniref:Lactose permease n=1 Tax=Plectosphaerella cucumerina TaxID=40658 RepID=A0A8K0TJB0_9PEZI|nr:lactose permease [Plectosphaerella cucumerina]
MSEKIDTVDSVQPHDDGADKKQIETKVIKGNEAFNEAMFKEDPKPWTKQQILLYCCSLIGFFCSTMNGYDGSLINNLLINPAFKEKWNVENTGIWAGIISSMYQIGGVVALPFVGPAIDTWGRRWGMFFGSITIIIGTIIQALANVEGQFMGGRFLLGFGVSIAASAGPMYVIEINHPAYRGVVGAMYNTLWFSGAILAAGASRGALQYIEGDASWRLITWLQCLFSGLICIFCFFLPESPRWLYVNNKKEAARAMLTKYHGLGNPDSAWVALQMNEYEELLDMDGADKRWWDYRALFRDRSSVYRLGCNLAVSIFGQWAGNAVLSYFLSSVLDTAGYTGTIAQANINLINTCQQFLCAICGALLVDRIGRRPLLLFSFTAVTVIWLAMTISSGVLDKSKTLSVNDEGKTVATYHNENASRACLAMIFLFGSCYSVGITPLQALYPVEVLSFEMRAKGMAFSSLAVNAAGLLNQFAWPVSMEKLGWKTYIIFTVWDAIQVTIIYFYLPETKNRTLEELDEVFHAANPVKHSTQKKEVAIDQYGEVINVQNV